MLVQTNGLAKTRFIRMRFNFCLLPFASCLLPCGAAARLCGEMVLAFHRIPL